MEHLVISGNKPLKGRVDISGAKNAAVAIIPATLCAGGVHTIENLPQIEDVRNYIAVLESMGAKCRLLNPSTLQVDARKANSTVHMPDNLKGMRASYYLIGALLGRYKHAVVPMPGGCNFGSRPIDQHIKGFEALGATVVQEHGSIFVSAQRLVGTKIYLDVASVGATINIMMAAVYAEGETTIENCAKEPHIVDCANFLNMCGANIKGAGTGVIRILGVKTSDMKDRDYTIIPDQIEAGTYMIAGAITSGEVVVRKVIPKHMEALSAKLQEMGCEIFAGDDWIKVRGKTELKPTTVTTLYYPGFPTDLQPQMTALLTQGNGTSYVTETVFENRFQYIDQLARLGAKVKIEGRMAAIEGAARLTGAHVEATDLRAGACLVVAALAAEGATKISNVHFIDRGYENIVDKLKALGASVRRIGDGEAPIVMEA
ncbi:MAG: UDP-N-acetylglucosamine 1-carboxyvinyltransferase [Defluviitaleaceae bacterium]|nr:UDP-N-acetylglucosamine 1-carboxyvinyltransferase [Defluviitaleaceae bacterium]